MRRARVGPCRRSGKPGSNASHGLSPPHSSDPGLCRPLRYAPGHRARKEAWTPRAHARQTEEVGFGARRPPPDQRRPASTNRSGQFIWCTKRSIRNVLDIAEWAEAVRGEPLLRVRPISSCTKCSGFPAELSPHAPASGRSRSGWAALDRGAGRFESDGRAGAGTGSAPRVDARPRDETDFADTPTDLARFVPPGGGSRPRPRPSWLNRATAAPRRGRRPGLGRAASSRDRAFPARAAPESSGRRFPAAPRPWSCRCSGNWPRASGGGRR